MKVHTNSLGELVVSIDGDEIAVFDSPADAVSWLRLDSLQLASASQARLDLAAKILAEVAL